MIEHEDDEPIVVIPFLTDVKLIQDVVPLEKFNEKSM